jgi:hypothetical protein
MLSRMNGLGEGRQVVVEPAVGDRGEQRTLGSEGLSDGRRRRSRFPMTLG